MGFVRHRWIYELEGRVVDPAFVVSELSYGVGRNLRLFHVLIWRLLKPVRVMLYILQYLTFGVVRYIQSTNCIHAWNTAFGLRACCCN